MSFVVNVIDLPWQNFLTPEFETKFQTEVPDFWRYPNFLITQSGWVEGGPYAKNQLDSYSRFNTTPACDKQTDGHRMTANTALA